MNFQELTTKEMVLGEPWKKGKIQLGNRSLYFDNDYPTEIVKNRKEYKGIKKAQKEQGICFQTPYTSMQKYAEMGAHTYNSAQ